MIKLYYKLFPNSLRRKKIKELKKLPISMRRYIRRLVKT